MSIRLSLSSSDSKYHPGKGFRVLSTDPVYLRVDAHGVEYSNDSLMFFVDGTQNIGVLCV